MATHRLGIIMHGVTGRMGTNQHLVRSILAIRADGGVVLPNGDRVMPDPILVGRNADKLEALARRHNVERWTTDLAAALADPADEVFFDAGTTQMRPALVRQAIEAGKHVYCEKPSATNLDDALAIARLAEARGVKNGIVQDKLFLPGLMKLKMLRDSGFFGRMLAVRGEFGYWVFEGDLQPIQRPSWNYRSEDGGGIILDMLCHWRYVLDHVFGAVESLSCLGATHITKRWDEDGKPYEATAEDAAYATFMLEGDVVAQINSSWQTRVYRDDLVTFQVDGTHGSAVAGLQSCQIQQRMATPRPGLEPRREARRRFPRRLAGGARHAELCERFSPSMGDVHPPRRRRTRRGTTRCSKAPRACSSPSWRRRAGARAAGSTCRRSRSPAASRAPGRSAMSAEPATLRRPQARRARLPKRGGGLETYRLGEASPFPAVASGPFNRVAFAAAHVVSDPLADVDPWLGAAIDWDATIAYRRRLWALGFSVAEAMDTAQRGMGLDWPTALELIRRSTAAAKAEGHRMLASGAGTDHLDPAAAQKSR